MARLTKLATSILTKKWHNKIDGDLILTGQVKPLINHSTLDDERLFCGVTECLEVASNLCNHMNGKDFPCHRKNFCDSHGADHQLHSACSLKTETELCVLRAKYNEDLFQNAIGRVNDKLKKQKVVERSKKTQIITKLAQINKIIKEKDEIITQVTSTKVKNKVEVIAKNQIFLDNIAEQLSKINVNDQVINNSTTQLSILPTDYMELQNYKKVKLHNERSLNECEQHLQDVVTNLIESANQSSRKLQHINFDIDMEEKLNTKYNAPNLHKLVNMYNLPMNKELQTLIDDDLIGSTMACQKRRTRFISLICQLLRSEEIVKVPQVKSTRHKSRELDRSGEQH
jgi:hypothetical protein